MYKNSQQNIYNLTINDTLKINILADNLYDAKAISKEYITKTTIKASINRTNKNGVLLCVYWKPLINDWSVL